MHRKRQFLSSSRIGQKMAAWRMLDTLTIKGRWPVLYPGVSGRRLKLRLAKGIRVIVESSGKFVDMVEVSLPKVLFGCNGQLIENQSQLSAALAKLLTVLRTFADVPDDAGWQVWRMDLVWNFDLSAKPLILAHASLRVPGIRRGANLLNDGQGVSWRGAASRLCITIYDKGAQLRVGVRALRAEVRLCGTQLTRRLCGRDWRDFSVLYQIYRLVMAGIPLVQKPASVKGWQEAVGMESPEIRRRIMARLADKPARTYRRWRQRSEAAAANLTETFSWNDMLPTDNPPPAVHVKRLGEKAK
jgi:hypothetical protein